MSTVPVGMAKDGCSKEVDNQKAARGKGAATPKLAGPGSGGGEKGNKATKGAYLK